jgi:hypothetical protein
MARDIFKPLSEYLKLAQYEWDSLSKDKEQDVESVREKEYHLGRKYMEIGRYEEAIKHLQKSTTVKQYRKEAYYDLAECYRQLKMIPLARKMYERLTRLDYNYKDIQEKIRELDSIAAFAPPKKPPVAAEQQTLISPEVTHSISAEDRYQILATIYEGAYARIYKVQDTLLGRTIALKHIDPSYPDREAYFRQMKALVVLDHPNILRIYDLDEQRGQITMEYLEGYNLRYLLQCRGALAPDMVMYIAIQLINGLHQAHTHGIVHQALTPEHLLLTRQCALKITDFLTADSFIQLQTLDEPYTAPYIPPEVARRKELTVVSNVYSCGVILYEMLTGHPPFTLKQIKTLIAQNTALPLDESLLPQGVAAILRHCLAMLPERRYSAIRTVGEALIRWYQKGKQAKTHGENVTTYKDFLLMAWADGKITEEEATFLSHKRKELNITEIEAQCVEEEVKQELKCLFAAK